MIRAPRPLGVGGGSELDPTERLLAEVASGGPKQVAISDSQLQKKATDERRRKADAVLEKHGLRPRPWV